MYKHVSDQLKKYWFKDTSLKHLVDGAFLLNISYGTLLKKFRC